MKTILKTFLGLVGASLAATSILTVSALAAANGIDSHNGDLSLTKSGNMWTGKFTIENIRGFSYEFDEPHDFSLKVNGASETLKAQRTTAYDKYKWASITISSGSGVKTKYTDGTSKDLSVTADSSGTILYGQYFGNIYTGSTVGSGVSEKVGVYLAMSGHMPNGNVEDELTE